MSRIKDYLFEIQEQQQDRRLAKRLGITYDELMQLGHTIDTEESKDGLVYNYVVSFDDEAPEEILHKVTGIDKNNTVWLSPWELEEEDYYEEQFNAIVSDKGYHKRFKTEIISAQKLNEIELEDQELQGVLRRQIYISIIGAIETFLSEAFINLTDENDEYFRNFVESFPDFKLRRFDLSQIFIEQGRIKETVRKVLLDVIYHHLAKVSNMYSSTFKMEFPDIAELAKCINIRHDLVHRNGKTKEGETVTVDEAAITDLIQKSSVFVDEIATKLNLTAGNGPFS